MSAQAPRRAQPEGCWTRPLAALAGAIAAALAISALARPAGPVDWRIWAMVPGLWFYLWIAGRPGGAR